MEKISGKQENKLTANYHRTRMQKELVLQQLREKGCRITKQRKILLDIILQEECASCKEIYYKAISVDSSIGVATVYRMVNLLEDIGAMMLCDFLFTKKKNCAKVMGSKIEFV